MSEEIKSDYFWISWYQPTNDYRPIRTDSENILCWWNTGIRCSDDSATLVAHVRAPSVLESKELIQEYWPEADEWRFCEPTTGDRPASSRFTIPEHMEKNYPPLDGKT